MFPQIGGNPNFNRVIFLWNRATKREIKQQNDTQLSSSKQEFTYLGVNKDLSIKDCGDRIAANEFLNSVIEPWATKELQDVELWELAELAETRFCTGTSNYFKVDNVTYLTELLLAVDDIRAFVHRDSECRAEADTLRSKLDHAQFSIIIISEFDLCK